MSQIIDNLYIGGYNERPSTVTAIVCIVPESEYVPPIFNRGILFSCFPISSLIQTDVENRRNFVLAVNKVIDLLERKETVFLHCLEGINRSPAVAIVVLTIQKNMTVQAAFKFVKEKRKSISPEKHLKIYYNSDICYTNPVKYIM